MKARFSTSDRPSPGTGCAVVLEANYDPLWWHLSPALFTVRIIRKSPDEIRKELSDPGYKWHYTLEPGFGSFADSAAKAVNGMKNGSEEIALVVAAASGYAADFVFRSKADALLEIWDAENASSLWKAPPVEEAQREE